MRPQEIVFPLRLAARDILYTFIYTLCSNQMVIQYIPDFGQ